MSPASKQDVELNMFGRMTARSNGSKTQKDHTNRFLSMRSMCAPSTCCQGASDSEELSRLASFDRSGQSIPLLAGPKEDNRRARATANYFEAVPSRSAFRRRHGDGDASNSESFTLDWDQDLIDMRHEYATAVAQQGDSHLHDVQDTIRQELRLDHSKPSPVHASPRPGPNQSVHPTSRQAEPSRQQDGGDEGGRGCASAFFNEHKRRHDGLGYMTVVTKRDDRSMVPRQRREDDHNLENADRNVERTRGSSKPPTRALTTQRSSISSFTPPSHRRGYDRPLPPPGQTAPPHVLRAQPAPGASTSRYCEDEDIYSPAPPLVRGDHRVFPKKPSTNVNRSRSKQRGSSTKRTSSPRSAKSNVAQISGGPAATPATKAKLVMTRDWSNDSISSSDVEAEVVNRAGFESLSSARNVKVSSLVTEPLMSSQDPSLEMTPARRKQKNRKKVRKNKRSTQVKPEQREHETESVKGSVHPSNGIEQPNLNLKPIEPPSPKTRREMLQDFISTDLRALEGTERSSKEVQTARETLSSTVETWLPKILSDIKIEVWISRGVTKPVIFTLSNDFEEVVLTSPKRSVPIRFVGPSNLLIVSTAEEALESEILRSIMTRNEITSSPGVIDKLACIEFVNQDGFSDRLWLLFPSARERSDSITGMRLMMRFWETSATKASPNNL